MMQANGVYRIKPPMTEARFDMIQEEGEEGTDLQDRGEFVELDFSLEEQVVRASANKPRVGKGDELQ